MPNIDLDFVQHLTLEERAALVSGKDFWFAAKVPGVDKMMVSDGPSGLRKQADPDDAVGLNKSVDAVCFPCSALTASSFDEQLLFKLGNHLGIAATAENIGILLGPGVNIKRSPLAGRNFEYFSEDPLLAGRMATAYVKGVQEEGVGVSVKHFATNNREDQRFTSSSNVDERTLREIYLAQFERIVKEAKPATIMCSYNKLNGIQVSQNQRLLTHILRDEWGFEGLVMSDWGAVVDHVAAIKAGLDLEMPGKGAESVNEIVRAVNDGHLQESILDKAALRVLKMVEKWQPKHAVNYDKEEQHDFARQLADESIVLLQNKHHLLPLNDTQSIAVIGELAAKPRFQGGGSSHVNAHRLVTPLEAMPASATYAQGYQLEHDKIDNHLAAQAVELAERSDVVVFFAGFPEAMESEGFDKQSIALPTNQNDLLDQITQANSHVVVVLQNGSVVEMPWANQVDGIVETYLAGEAVGESTWDILLGKVNPAGKLSESFPLRLVDNPTALTFNTDHDNETYHEGLFVGYRYYDKKQLPTRFPFGHGLSYTTFGYQGLNVENQSDHVHVSLQVTNTGERAGKEVVQVYVQNLVSQIEMPVKELRDFAKVDLQPGEATTVEFNLPRRAFAWYNSQTDALQTDNGQYTILVGSSSTDLRLSQSFKLTIGTPFLSRITGETYVSDLLANRTPKIDQALETTGLGKVFDQLLANQANRALFANIPLRSFTVTGVKPETISKFIQLVNN